MTARKAPKTEGGSASERSRLVAAGSPPAPRTARARMLTEAELADPVRLLNELSRLLADPAALHAMGEQARTLARPDAARQIASMVVDHAHRG